MKNEDLSSGEVEMDSDEKRKSPRFNVINSRRVYISNNDMRGYFTGKIINISMSGLMLECQCELSKVLELSHFELKFDKMGDKGAVNLLTKGKSVRIKKGKEKNLFYVGLEFLETIQFPIWLQLLKTLGNPLQEPV